MAETETGFAALNADGSVASEHEALTDALRAACPPVDAERGILREAGALVGEWRWLDASSAENASEFPDGHIDEATIIELVDGLNAASMPVPIDGGAVDAGMLPSPVHGTARDSGTPANGWAHRAVAVRKTGEPLHVYLWAELWPSIAREFDRGRLAFGSVLVEAARKDASGALRGARLMGHALTNNPANRQLTPSTAVRSDDVAAVVLRSGPSLLRSHTMPKPKKSADAAEAKPAETVAREDMPPAEAEVETEVEVEDKDAKIAALEARVAELTGALDAMRAEAEARAMEGEDPEKVAAAEAERKEREAVTAVDDAIKAGRVAAAVREKWLAVARSSVEQFAELTAGLRAFPAARQAKAGETKARHAPAPAELDPTDPLVVAMRGAGIPDDRIASRIAARSKEI